MKNQKAVFSQNAAMKLTTPSRQFFKPALATTLAIGSWRLVLLLATAVSPIGYPKPANAATVDARERENVHRTGPPVPSLF